jgi:hypothetical protein
MGDGASTVRTATGQLWVDEESSAMKELIEVLGDHMWVLIVGGIIASCVVSTVVKGITAICNTACRERTRREIAAYIAEGSMSPDQGERLLRADVNKGGAMV